RRVGGSGRWPKAGAGGPHTVPTGYTRGTAGGASRDRPRGGLRGALSPVGPPVGAVALLGVAQRHRPPHRWDGATACSACCDWAAARAVPPWCRPTPPAAAAESHPGPTPATPH